MGVLKLITEKKVLHWIAESINPDYSTNSDLLTLKNKRCHSQLVALRLIVAHSNENKFSKTTELALDSYERSELVLRLKQLLRRKCIVCMEETLKTEIIELSDLSVETLAKGFFIELTEKGILDIKSSQKD